MSNHLSLSVIEGEPRVHDLVLAERLGFDRPRNIRNIIKRNMAKLLKFGVCSTVKQTHTEAGGRPTEEYYLNQKQAIFICMKSETEQAFDVQVEIVLVFDAYLKGEPLDTLIPSEQQLLHEIVKHKAHASVPAELIGKAIPEIWSRIHHKFHIAKYEQLPRTQLTNAILYVNQMELRTGKKAIPKEEPTKALPFHVHYPMETAAPPVGYNGLSGAVFCESAWSDPGWALLMRLREAGFNVDGPIYSHYAKLHVIKLMRTTLVGKANDMLDALCATLPYAPIYIR